MKKNALFVDARSWDDKDKVSLFDKIDTKNYRWQAEILQDGRKKFAFFYSKVDLEILAIEQNFTILNVKKLAQVK